MRPDEAKPFLAHLDELRSVLIHSLLAWLIGVFVAIPFAPKILALLRVPLEQISANPERALQSLEVTGALSSTMRMAAWSGLVLALPWMVYFICRFVFPGLTGKEIQWVRLGGGASIVLFLSGVLLGYGISLEVALKVMQQIHRWLGVEPFWTLNSYIAFCIQLLIGFGLAFQLPILVFVLGRLGVVSVEQLQRKRRHVFVGLLIVAMLMTPPDPLTQLILAIPLYLLYELCIVLLNVLEKKS